MSPSARGAQICATGSGSGVVPLVSCDGRHNLPPSCRFEAAESALYSRKGGSRLAARHIESLPGLRLAGNGRFCCQRLRDRQAPGIHSAAAYGVDAAGHHRRAPIHGHFRAYLALTVSVRLAAPVIPLSFRSRSHRTVFYIPPRNCFTENRQPCRFRMPRTD